MMFGHDEKFFLLSHFYHSSVENLPVSIIFAYFAASNNLNIIHR